MKTEAIKAEILENYKQLSQLAYVKPEKAGIVSTWGLVLFVSAIGFLGMLLTPFYPLIGGLIS